MIRRLGVMAAAITLMISNGTSLGAADFTIGSGEMVTTTQTLGDDENGTVEKGGKISTSGVNQEAIQAGARNTIRNEGTISASNSGASGISATEYNSIANSGTISTAGGNAAYAIYTSGDENTITNSGTILTVGNSSNAIHADGGTNIIANSGYIKASGAAADGIYTQGGSTIINSGTIISEQDDAIHLHETGSTVYLLAGSAIYGDLELMESDNSFDIGNGLSARLVFQTEFPDHLNFNGMPHVSDADNMQLAAVDPTGFAMADEMLVDLTDLVFSAVSHHLADQSNDKVALSSTMSIAPASKHFATGTSVWGSIFGSWREQEDGGTIWSNNHRLAGLISGFDGAWFDGMRGGFFLGSARAELSVDDDAQDIEAQSYWAGIHLSRDLGNHALDLAALAGWQSHDSTRRLVDNTVAGGIDYAEASYDGFVVSTEARLSKPWAVRGRPVLSSLILRYGGLFLEAYEEAGSNADLAVDARDVHSGIAKGQIALPLALPLASGELQAEGHVGAEARYVVADDVSAVLLAEDIAFEPGGESFVFGGFAGATVAFASDSGSLVLRAGADAAAANDRSLVIAARLGAELSF
jgi:hypothetical protein